MKIQDILTFKVPIFYLDLSSLLPLLPMEISRFEFSRLARKHQNQFRSVGVGGFHCQPLTLKMPQVLVTPSVGDLSPIQPIHNYIYIYRKMRIPREKPQIWVKPWLGGSVRGQDLEGADELELKAKGEKGFLGVVVRKPRKSEAKVAGKLLLIFG